MDQKESAMKNKLFAVALAGCCFLPVITQADPPPSKPSRKTVKAAAAAKTAAVKADAAKQQEVDYISRTPATGSHIPAVWRSYDGHMVNASNLKVYNQNDLNRAGQLDVASELSLVDPSIQLVRGR